VCLSVCVCARCVLSLRAHVGGRPLIKRTHTSCDPSAIAGGQPAVERLNQDRYSILRPPTRGRCGSIAILCISSCACCPLSLCPHRHAPTRAILEDDGCVAPWWLSLCVMRRLISASLSVCVCRCGTFVSVAVLLALQFIMSAATCLRLVHGRSVSSCPSAPSRSECICVCAYVCACACCCRCGCGLV